MNAQQRRPERGQSGSFQSAEAHSRAKAARATRPKTMAAGDRGSSFPKRPGKPNNSTAPWTCNKLRDCWDMRKLTVASGGAYARRRNSSGPDALALRVRV